MSRILDFQFSGDKIRRLRINYNFHGGFNGFNSFLMSINMSVISADDFNRLTDSKKLANGCIFDELLSFHHENVGVKKYVLNIVEKFGNFFFFLFLSLKNLR